LVGRCEEARGLVIGRKSHYGSKSKRGTEVAAHFYALFETAKLVDVDPRRTCAAPSSPWSWANRCPCRTTSLPAP